MSQTSAYTQYNVYLQDNNGQFGAITLNGSDGADDASVLSLVETLKGFAWPSAMGPVTVQATKTDSTVTNYAADLAASPPAFA